MFIPFVGTIGRSREEDELKVRQLNEQIDAEAKEIDDLFKQLAPEAHAKFQSLEASEASTPTKGKKLSIQELQAKAATPLS